MSHEHRNQNQRDQFAVAMALGERVSVWAKKNGVPRRTCYDWRKTPAYKVTVREARRRALDRAVGQFVRNLTKAVGRIALLATEAESESVQLQAARAVLRESIKVREHVDLEEQMTDIERRLDERDAKVP
ncbi:MAG: hypothetical protein ACHRXM_32765 [Isosphaerales bacterium]